MPFRDLGFNFTYYYFINSLVCVSQNLFCLIGLRPNPLSLEIARISSALYSLIRGFDDAKVQRLLPDSKNLGEIFPELLRQGW